MFENINLWVARNNDGELITIDEINEINKKDQYFCPICNSEVITRLGDIKSHHFAHVDKSKCDNEAMVHFWVKNKLIEKGDVFKIRLDKEVKEFKCKDVIVEQNYDTEFGVYNPDITIITEDNEIIYFEVANTNKKKLEEYLDRWIELGNIVVEVDSSNLINGKSIKEFKALYYKGKCFNINKESNDYYEFVGNLKIKAKNGEVDKSKVEQLNWLWRDIVKYKNNELDIETLANEIYAIEDEEMRNIIVSLLKKSSCNSVLNDYVKYYKQLVREEFMKQCDNAYNVYTKQLNKIYDRIYIGCYASIYSKGIEIYRGVVNYDDINLDSILMNNINHVKNIVNDYILDNNYEYNTFVKGDILIIRNLRTSEEYPIFNINSNEVLKIVKEIIKDSTYDVRFDVVFNCLNQLNFIDKLEFERKSKYGDWSCMYVNHNNVRYLIYYNDIYKEIISKYSNAQEMLEDNSLLTKLSEYIKKNIKEQDGTELHYINQKKLVADNVERLNEIYMNIKNKCKFELYDNYKSYTVKISGVCGDYKVYIDESITKITVTDSFTKPFRGKRGGIGWRRYDYDRTVKSIEYDEINDGVFKEIHKWVSDKIRKRIYNN